eukprot:scaffold1058_cov155-Ochromonas_danica.AAC.22
MDFNEYRVFTTLKRPPERSYNELELKLEELRLRRQMMEKRTEQKISLVQKMEERRRQGHAHLLESLEKQNEEAKRRNRKLLEDVALSSSSIVATSSEVHYHRQKTLTRLEEAKTSFRQLQATASEALQQSRWLRLEEELSHLREEERQALLRAEKIKAHRLREAQLGERLGSQRQQLLHSLAREHHERVEAEAEAFLRLEESQRLEQVFQKTLQEDIEEVQEQIREKIRSFDFERRPFLLQDPSPPPPPMLPAGVDSVAKVDGGLWTSSAHVPPKPNNPQPAVTVQTQSLTSALSFDLSLLTASDNSKESDSMDAKAAAMPPSALTATTSTSAVASVSVLDYGRNGIAMRKDSLDEVDQSNHRSAMASSFISSDHSSSMVVSQPVMKDYSKTTQLPTPAPPAPTPPAAPSSSTPTVSTHEVAKASLASSASGAEDEFEVIASPPPPPPPAPAPPIAIESAAAKPKPSASPQFSNKKKVIDKTDDHININSNNKVLSTPRKEEKQQQQEEEGIAPGRSLVHHQPSPAVIHATKSIVIPEDEFDVALDVLHPPGTAAVLEVPSASFQHVSHHHGYHKVGLSSSGGSVNKQEHSNQTAGQKEEEEDDEFATFDIPQKSLNTDKKDILHNANNANIADAKHHPHHSSHHAARHLEELHLEISTADTFLLCNRLLLSLYPTVEKHCSSLQDIKSFYSLEAAQRVSMQHVLQDYVTKKIDLTGLLGDLADHYSGHLILVVVETLGHLLLPKEAFTGVVTTEKLKKEHKKSSIPNLFSCWDALCSHLQRLVEEEPSSRLDFLAKCFTNVLIAHVPLDDKDRMHRKVFNLLQLAILPPSLHEQDNNASPYRKKAIVSTSNDFSTGLLPIVSSEQDLSNAKGSISGNTGPLRGKSSLSAVNYGPSSSQQRNSFEVNSSNSVSNSLSKSSMLKGPAFESLTASNANNKLSELEDDEIMEDEIIAKPPPIKDLESALLEEEQPHHAPPPPWQKPQQQQQQQSQSHSRPTFGFTASRHVSGNFYNEASAEEFDF